MRKVFSILILSALLITLCSCTVPATTGSADTDPAATELENTATPTTSRAPTDNSVAYPIGNLTFFLPEDTEVSVKPSTNTSLYSFPVVSGQAFLLVNATNVSGLSVNTLDGFVSLAQKTLTDDYEKIGIYNFSMDVAGFPASGETFSVLEDNKFHHYNVMSFTDTYYAYTFIYMTRSDVSDSVECTAAYADLIGNLEYTGRVPRT